MAQTKELSRTNIDLKTWNLQTSKASYYCRFDEEKVFLDWQNNWTLSETCGKLGQKIVLIPLLELWCTIPSCSTYISAKPDTWCTQLLYLAWKLCQSEMKNTIFINPSVIGGAKLKNQITHLLCLCSKWRISQSKVLNMTSSFQLENWELDGPTCVYLAWVWYKLLQGLHLLINYVSSSLWCHNKKHQFLTLNANLYLSTWIMKHKTTITQEVLCSGC
jgi:hypothetical protein